MIKNDHVKKRVAKFFHDIAHVFMPPFEGLPAILWCYFILSYVALPHNTLWRGDLPDPDDYTYLTQTLDWLKGQGWFDNIQHRMAPPDGVAIHYTRFAEMPIASAIMLFRVFHYSWYGAALLGSFLLPIIYLGFLFSALRWAAAKILTPEWTKLTSFVVLFAPALMFKFAPGQVDHHGLEAILVILGVGCTVQMFSYPKQLQWAIGCGFVYALAIAIALEVLPWMTLTAAIIGLWVTVMGAKVARSAEAFGISLLLAGVIFLIFERPSGNIYVADLLSYSIAYVLLMAGIACVLLAAARFSIIENIKTRFILSVGVAVALGALYLWQFPDLLGGPYGAMNKKLALLFFNNLEEAEPMIVRYSVFKSILLLFTPLLGLAMCLVKLRDTHEKQKWGWFLIALQLFCAIILSVFYQIRVLIYALLFSVIPLVAFIEGGGAWIRAQWKGRQLFWAEIALVLLVGPLTTIFIPALSDGRSFNTGVILFPAQSFDDSCQMRELETVLNSPPYQGRKLNIVNMIDEGPELLFRTSDTVLSAPYHTNVKGNLDALDFFSTTDMQQAKQIAEHNHIDLVVMCRNVPDMYFHDEGVHYARMPDGSLKMHADPSLAGQLMIHNVPDWLKEIPVAGPAYLLFEVKQ